MSYSKFRHNHREEISGGIWKSGTSIGAIFWFLWDGSGFTIVSCRFGLELTANPFPTAEKPIFLFPLREISTRCVRSLPTIDNPSAGNGLGKTIFISTMAFTGGQVLEKT